MRKSSDNSATEQGLLLYPSKDQYQNHTSGSSILFRHSYRGLDVAKIEVTSSSSTPKTEKMIIITKNILAGKLIL